MSFIAGIKNKSPVTYDQPRFGVTGPSVTGPTGPTGPAGSAFPFHSTAINYTTTAENMLVDVTANAVVVTIGTGFNAVTVKDRTGSPTPTIGIEAQSGAELEDPNNLGNASDFATEVFLKQPGGGVSFRFNGTIYEVISST